MIEGCAHAFGGLSDQKVLVYIHVHARVECLWDCGYAVVVLGSLTGLCVCIPQAYIE